MVPKRLPAPAIDLKLTSKPDPTPLVIASGLKTQPPLVLTHRIKRNEIDRPGRRIGNAKDVGKPVVRLGSTPVISGASIEEETALYRPSPLALHAKEVPSAQVHDEV